MPVMEHSIGMTTHPPISILGMVPPDHPPVRKYYIARNSVVSIMSYWRREPVWCLKRMGGLCVKLMAILLLHEDKPPKLRAFFAGILDGVSHRMGPLLK